MFYQQYSYCSRKRMALKSYYNNISFYIVLWSILKGAADSNPLSGISVHVSA